DPICVGGHAVGLPDHVGQVMGQRPAGGALHHQAQQVGLGGVVVPVRARRVLARQFAQVGQRVGLAVHAAAQVHPCHVGLRVGVVLVPAHARGHGQQLAHGDVGVGAVGQFGNIGGQRVFQA